MEWMPNYLNPCQKVYLPLLKGEQQIRELKEICKDTNISQITCMPYVHLAGVNKCGTSDLYRLLRAHPHIHMSVKEVEFWKNSNSWNWRQYLDVFNEPSKCIQSITDNTSFHPSITSEKYIFYKSIIKIK